MQNVTLYGKGAVRLLHGKDTIVAENGRISVPAALVAQVLAMGFTRQPTGEDTEVVDTVAKIEAPEVAAVEGSGELTKVEEVVEVETADVADPDVPIDDARTLEQGEPEKTEGEVAEVVEENKPEAEAVEVAQDPEIVRNLEGDGDGPAKTEY